jgi:hypothetical protein
MRILLPASLAAIACAVPAHAATRNFGISSFERIRVEGPYRVQLTTGVAPYASASGSQAALDRVAIDMIGETLVVHYNVSAWGSDTSDNGPVDIRIGTHDLSTVILNGSGLLQVDKVKALTFNAFASGSGQLGIAKADVDQLNVTIAGTASAILGGQAGTLRLTVRGASAFDGSGLSTKDATIGADGAATIKAAVTNSATVSGSGPATITLTGNPACTARMTGAASVSGCKASQ